MKGDRMLCMNPACYKLFKEAEGFHDSRNPRIKRMCPYCTGTNTVNVEYLVEKFIKATRCKNKDTIALDEDIIQALRIVKAKGVKLVA